MHTIRITEWEHVEHPWALDLLECLSVLCFYWLWSTLTDNSRYQGLLLEILSWEAGLRLQWLYTEVLAFSHGRLREEMEASLPQLWGRAYCSECLRGAWVKRPPVVCAHDRHPYWASCCFPCSLTNCPKEHLFNKSCDRATWAVQFDLVAVIKCPDYKQLGEEKADLVYTFKPYSIIKLSQAGQELWKKCCLTLSVWFLHRLSITCLVMWAGASYISINDQVVLHRHAHRPVWSSPTFTIKAVFHRWL